MSKENKKYQVNIKSSKGKTMDGSPSDSSNNSSAQNVDPNKYKNFDKVYNSYADSIYKKPWYSFQFYKSKNRKVTLYIMVILIVAALVIMEFVKEN